VFDRFTHQLLVLIGRIMFILGGLALVAKFAMPVILANAGGFLLVAILFYALKLIIFGKR
jgi:hypothetical protein